MNEEYAIELLKRYAPNQNIFDAVLRHSKKVREIALRYAQKIPEVDIEFIKTGSLLHDIGRFKFKPGKTSLYHGIHGAEIVRKEGLPERYALLCERHIGAGISREEIERRGLDLPKKDYMPVSKEEKIITHADNLVFGAEEVSIKDAVGRFKNKVGDATSRKIQALYEEVVNMMLDES
jgi:uncharacterized protein